MDANAKNIVKLVSNALEENFDANFYDLIVWRIAFFLSIKSDIDIDSLSEYAKGVRNNEQRVQADFTSVCPDNEKYLFANLLAIKHNRKIDILNKDDFHKLVERHCRHGFNLLEQKFINVKSNLLEFFIGELSNVETLEIENNKQKNKEKDKIALEFIKAFRELDFSLEYKEKQSYSRINKYFFEMKNLQENAKLKKRETLEALEAQTALHNRIFIDTKTNRARTISINVLTKESVTINLSKYKHHFDNFSLSLVFGITSEDTPLKADLDEMPHLMVGGTTGSGKTVLLHVLIKQLLEKKAIELILIDPKSGVAFGKYQKKCKVIKNTTDALEKISSIVEEMERRYKNDNFLIDKPIIVVIDELADLMMQNKEIENELVRIAQKGRQAKIHLILATQRPDSKILTGTLRSNIPSRIALKVQKSSESKIILDDTGAEKLIHKGEMLCKFKNDIIRLQGLYTK